MTARYDIAQLGHMTGGEHFKLSRGRWVRPDGGPVDLFHFFRCERADWNKVPEGSATRRNAYQLKRDAENAARLSSAAWGSDYGFQEAREGIRALCDQEGVKYPESKWGIYPEMLRTEAPEWWGRQLKKADRRALEYAALKAGAINHYCSQELLKMRQIQRRDTVELLRRLEAVCELQDGEQIKRDLLDLVRSSQANPAVRRAELMCRIRGFEEYAKARGHVALFLTATCPSRFHRNSGEDRWNGASPREAQDYLCEVWARARAALKRAGIELYGVRIAEPHKDACPHWHMLYWFRNSKEARDAVRIMRAYFLADTPDEPGAQRRRFTIKRINPRRGSATGYIAKYVCKNVDGVFRDGGETRTFADARRNATTGKMEETGIASDHAALCVEAWASCWGVRQFQIIGGPNVGVWRELRRMREEYTGEGADLVEPLRAAADAGQWDLFMQLDGEHRARFGGRVRVWSETSTDKLIELQRQGRIEDDEAVKSCLNKWQEPKLREVKGVAVGWMKLKTRFLKWVLMLKKALEEKSRAQIEREAIFDFMERIHAGRAAAAGAEATAAKPPGPLEFCQ